MFKSSIRKKLSIYFTLLLVTFSLIIGSVFMLLFRNYSLDLNKNDIKNKAVSIAETIPKYLEGQNKGMQGFGMYLRVINEIENSDIWIVDENLNLITSRNYQNQRPYEYRDLPDGADKLVSDVLLNKVVFSEDFSKLLDETSLTVGVPIVNKSNQVIGAVLLHSPVVGVNLAIKEGIIILIASTTVALLLASALALILSRYFTKPLVKINEKSLQLIDGDYQVNFKVNQKDEIGQLASTLDILAKRLLIAKNEEEKLEKMRQDFIANISHELKTPVTVMRGSLEALVDEVVSDKALIKDYHKQMLNEAKFLERLINDLLDLSKLQSLEFKIVKREVSISDVIDEVVKSAKKLAKDKDIEIEVIREVSDIRMLADYQRLRQMFMVVLDNAVKFSKFGSKVTVTMSKDQIIIKDYGEGIEAEDLPYIFERFYQSRFEGNKVGTGLGLAISKKIADRHNIEIEVESSKNIGSSFIFKFK